MKPKASLSAQESYAGSMAVVRRRFLYLESEFPPEPVLMTAERFGLQMRKILEGVAYACLSAAEISSNRTMDALRTKDADKLLVWLKAKGLLRLPNAQRREAHPEFKFALSGLAQHDLTVADLKAAYGRASNIVHEQHPERISVAQLTADLAQLKADVQRLRDWLWVHIMFVRSDAYLIQMDMFDRPDFIIPLTKQADLSKLS